MEQHDYADKITNSRPYLRGTGWERRVSAINSGRRYVPKGGHIVDFSAVQTARRLFQASDDAPEGSSQQQLPVGKRPASVGMWHSHEALLNGTSEPLDAQSTADQDRSATITHYSAAQQQHRDDGFEQRGGGLSSPSRQQWRPPGPPASLLSSTRMKMVASRSGRRGKASKAQAAPPPPHDCENCACCLEARQKLEAAEVGAKKERATAAQLRRRLEAEVAKVAKEHQEFEAQKAETMVQLKEAATEAARKKERDLLAENAKQRVQTKGDSQSRAKVDALRAELDAERRESGLAEGRRRVEAARLRARIAQLEKETKELDEAAREAETQRMEAWEELRRLKAAKRLAGAGQAAEESAAAAATGVECGASAASDPGSSERSCLSIQTASGEARSSPGRPADAAFFPASNTLTAAWEPALLDEVIHFANGTERRHWRNGHALTTYTNGDKKQEWPSGIVEYYYQAVDTWQVSHPSGVDCFHFASGQVEAHLPAGGGRETLLPAGMGAVRTLPDGTELPVPPASLRQEMLRPRPTPFNENTKQK